MRRAAAWLLVLLFGLWAVGADAAVFTGDSADRVAAADSAAVPDGAADLECADDNDDDDDADAVLAPSGMRILAAPSRLTLADPLAPSLCPPASLLFRPPRASV